MRRNGFPRIALCFALLLALSSCATIYDSSKDAVHDCGIHQGRHRVEVGCG
ncbi:MAG: hypothetical protein WC159_08885 [Sphaerochaetaceae bacterium]